MEYLIPDIHFTFLFRYSNTNQEFPPNVTESNDQNTPTPSTSSQHGPISEEHESAGCTPVYIEDTENSVFTRPDSDTCNESSVPPVLTTEQLQNTAG